MSETRRPRRAKTTARPHLDRNSHVPAYHQIADWLRDRVQSEALLPLARLPSEFELVRLFETSRTTARKALDLLAREGILFRRAGKGTFVSASRIQYGASTGLSFSALMTALGYRTTTKVLLAKRVPAPAHVALALGAPPSAKVVCIRRLRRLDGMPVAIHTTYVLDRFDAILRRDLAGSLHDSLRAVGARETESRDELEATVATDEVARLLDVPAGSPLVRVEGVGFSAAQEPLRYTEGVYRADRFRFRVGMLRGAEPRMVIKAEPRRLVSA